MRDLFHAIFRRDPQAAATAPGRVNLIGEHTDYNGGAVLPTVIPQHTTVALAPRDDRLVRVHTTMGDATATYALGGETRRHDCFDYVQGCTWALGEAGISVPGCDVVIDSAIPAGSGLSSSAALEVAFLRALRAIAPLPADDAKLAQLAHRAESGFVGARVGIMDQLAVSLADADTALYLDTRTHAHRRVPLPKRAALVVIDSGVRHALATGGYNTRRAECERAASALGVTYLCELGAGALERITRLPAPLDRRARHVVTEHARVAEAVRAMRADDVERLGALFVASHASQRDDYEVSVPAVDWLVQLALEEPGVYGARLTGGGFGGSVVVLAARTQAEAVAARIADRHRRETGSTATVVMPLTR